MFNKSLVRLVVVSTIILILIVYFQATNTKDGTELFHNIKLTRELNNDLSEYVVLEIGDRKITNKEFNIIKAGRQCLKNESDNEIIQNIINYEITKMIAREKNITVDKEEVLSYMQTIKDESIKNKNTKELLEKYYDAYGLDADTFWDSQLAYNLYENLLVITRLNKSIGKKQVDILIEERKREVKVYINKS